MSQGGDEERADRGDSLDDVALDALSAADGETTGEARDETEPTEPVAAYCDRLGLDVPGRLRVFQQVCLVVHQAHQKGLIFGDLSPSRLTIAPDGAVVVPTARGEDEREIGEWSSPERVLGEPPTMAGDIHALGVLLYELLTGKRPYRVDYEDPGALAEAIVDQVPERPSRAAPRGRGRIGTDLDLIVGRALCKEPERRYASAAELADDLDRYRARLPVRARRSTEIYRLKMFLKRRKWVAPAVVLLALGVAAGVIEGVRRYGLVRLERDRAERYRGWAGESLARALDRLADEPSVGDDPRALRRGLLEDLDRYYDALSVGDVWISNIERADNKTKRGLIARALGDRDEAVEQLQSAVALWELVVAWRPDDFDLARRLAEAQADLGRTLDSGEGAAGAETDEALRNLESARKLLIALADAHPESTATRRALARTLGDLARLQRRRGSDQALGSIRGAVKLWEELVLEDPADLDARLALVSSLGLRARLEEGRPDGAPAALKALQRADEVLSAAPIANKGPTRLTFEQAKRLNDLASLERNLGAAPAALGHATHASELLESLSAQFPSEPNYRAELALTRNLLAELRRGVGERAKAQEQAGKARELLERLMVEEPDDPAHPIDLATTWQLIGRLHGQSRENVEALRAFRRAIDLLEGRDELDGPGRYALACNLSLGLSLVGARDGARPPDDDDPALTPTDKLRRQVYANRAVAVLGQAIAQGFGDLDLYRTDPTLDPLRSRDDFKKLLADLAAKADGGP